jgi:hypothetical protein
MQLRATCSIGSGFLGANRSAAPQRARASDHGGRSLEERRALCNKLRTRESTNCATSRGLQRGPSCAVSCYRCCSRVQWQPPAGKMTVRGRVAVKLILHTLKPTCKRTRQLFFSDPGFRIQISHREKRVVSGRAYRWIEIKLGESFVL